MSWEGWQGELDDEGVSAFGPSNASPPSVARIVASTGVSVLGIAGMLVMSIRGNWSAAGGIAVFLTVVLYAWPRGPFNPYRFADNREWALSKDGLHFQNRASIPAAALTRVEGCGGRVVLHFKENDTDASLRLNGVAKSRRLRAALREMIRERKDVTE